MTSQSQGRLYTQDEAAHYLSTTKRQVRELWAKRRLGGVKIGRKVRHRQSDLDEFIARNGREAMR